MSGIVDDVTSVFSNVGDTISGWFGGGSDAASAAASAASDASSAATDASDYLSGAADSASSGMSDAIDTGASSAGSLYQNMDNATAASYTAGVTTSDWSTGADAMSISPDDASGLGSPYTSAAVGLGSNQQSWLGRMTSGVSSFFGGGGGGGGGGSSTGSLLMGEMLGRLGGAAISAWGAYKMNQPKPPNNFSGRTPGGGGGGLGMHTTNGGFGLAPGGTETPPSGVPNQLVPNAQAEQLGGSGGLTRAAPPPVAGAPNLQQTVANQAGVGGLIPQGAVNFMKGPSNG